MLHTSDLECLGRQSHGSLGLEILGFGAVDQVLADFLEGLDLAGGQGDADLVDFLRKTSVRTLERTMYRFSCFQRGKLTGDSP